MIRIFYDFLYIAQCASSLSISVRIIVLIFSVTRSTRSNANVILSQTKRENNLKYLSIFVDSSKFQDFENFD